MLREVSLQLRRQPGMLSLNAGLLRIGARRLALDRQACLFRLHKLVAQLRRMADDRHQGLTAGFHVLFGGAELEVQILLAHDHLGQRVLRRGKFLLQFLHLLGALGRLLLESGKLRLELGAFARGFLRARLQVSGLLLHLLQAGEQAFALQVALGQTLAALGELIFQFFVPLRGAFLLVLQRFQFLGRRQAGFLHLGEFRAQPLELHLQRLQAGCQDGLQAAAQLLMKFAVAPRLRGLALQRVHLLRDFFQNVGDARQVLPRRFQLGLRQALAGFEFGNAGGFFQNQAPVRRFRTEDLADAPLLDDGIRLRAQPGSHEKVLNITQAADVAIDQILAFT